MNLGRMTTALLMGAFLAVPFVGAQEPFEWSPITGNLEGEAVFTIDCPKHWDAALNRHWGAFVHFVTMAPAPGNMAEFSVQMRNARLRSETAPDLDSFATQVQESLARLASTDGEVRVEPAQLSGLDARRVLYRTQNNADSTVDVVATLVLVDDILFMLRQRTPVGQDSLYAAAFLRMLDSFKLDPGAVRRAWKAHP